MFSLIINICIFAINSLEDENETSRNHIIQKKIPHLTLRYTCFSLFFSFLIFKIYLFLVALGLRCCARAFSSCSESGLLLVVVCGLLIAVASLVAEHRLSAHGLQYLWLVGSVVVARGL